MPYKDKEAQKQAVRAWYLRNKALTQARANAWKRSHREYCKEQNKAWAEANPDKRRASRQRYRMRHREKFNEKRRQRRREKREKLFAWLDGDKKAFETSHMELNQQAVVIVANLKYGKRRGGQP